MVWDLFKSLLIFFTIVIGFTLLLLLPREMAVTHHGGLVFTADFPFTLELWKEHIQAFIQHFQTEKGFGVNRTGVPILEDVQNLVKRDLTIIIPAFLLSIIFGVLLGIVQFYFRNRVFGKIQGSLSWILTSIPDFFLYIAIQYLLIKLIHAGLPQFSLFGNDHWYSFILPMLAVMIFPLNHMMKFTSSSLENEVGQDYLRTARAKGLKRSKILKHMLWNCFYTLFNQTQFVMLYILTSLPIIEKLSSFQGAGYHLLGSITNNEDPRALALAIPYLFLMFATIVISKTLKHWLVPQKSGEFQ